MNTLLDCQHKRLHFVTSAKGNDERYRVQVCEDCGLIMVWMFKQGVDFKLNFHIYDQATIDTIRSYANWVEQNE